MQTVPKRFFIHEYRAEAVKLVIAEGMGPLKQPGKWAEVSRLKR